MRWLRWLKWAGLALLVVLAVRGLSCPQAPPTYKTVEVPAEAIKAQKPKVEIARLKRLLWESLEREQRAVARGGAVQPVIDFCRPVIRTPAGVDSLPSVPLPDVRMVMDAIRVDDPLLNPFAPSTVDLFGFNNAGDLIHDQYKAGPGDIECVVEGGESVCRSQRFGWVGPVITHGAATGLGVGIGYLLKSLAE